MGTNRTAGKLTGSGRQMIVATAIGESVVYCAVAGKDMGSKRQLYGSSHSVCDLNHKMAVAATLWFLSEKSTPIIQPEYG
jgi:hypothetical protein